MSFETPGVQTPESEKSGAAGSGGNERLDPLAESWMRIVNEDEKKKRL